MVGRQQFNVTLPPDLVRQLKYRAIDAQLSASHFVERVLRAQLATQENQMTGLNLQPMVHVEDMAASLAFYEALGAQVAHGSRDGDFVMLTVGNAQLSLLAHPPNPEQNEVTVELNFDTERELTDVESALRVANVEIAQPVTDEGFGRQLQVRSPDGLLIKINQLEPDLYS